MLVFYVVLSMYSPFLWLALNVQNRRNEAIAFDQTLCDVIVFVCDAHKTLSRNECKSQLGAALIRYKSIYLCGLFMF